MTWNHDRDPPEVGSYRVLVQFDDGTTVEQRDTWTCRSGCYWWLNTEGQEGSVVAWWDGCPTCRPSDVPIAFGSAHYEAHLRRGIVRTRCPGCDEYRWPWEYPEPEWPASGLLWFWSPLWKEWRLYRGDRLQGSVTPRAVCERPLVCDAYRATRYVATGTLHDCARALVAEVRR